MAAVRVTEAPSPHRLRPCAAALLALAAAQAASAQAPRLTAIGAGAGVTCAGWSAAGHSDPELERWAFGLASAVAAGVQLQRGTGPPAGMDADAVRTWLGGHRERRPGDPSSVALARMVSGPL